MCRIQRNKVPSRWRSHEKVLLIISSTLALLGPSVFVHSEEKSFLISFIMEASINGKIFVVRNHSEVMSCFKEFQAWMESYTNVLLESVHSDNAREYQALGNYLKTERIRKSFSTT